MTTVREVCQDALLELGVTDLIDVMDAAKGQYMLRLLNRMIQVWNTEELMVYTLNRTEYPLTAGKQVYTYGTGGDINAARPVRIQAMSVLINNATATPLEISVDLLTDEEWQAVAIKQTPSLFPTKCWVTGNFPLNSLWLWPVPQDATVKLVVYTWGKTEAFADLSDPVVFPNGYDEAIVTNLALHAASSFGVAPMPSLISRAMGSRSKVQSLNNEPLYASLDPTLVGSKGGTNAIRSFGRLVDRV